jgi:hypothetical protein
MVLVFAIFDWRLMMGDFLLPFIQLCVLASLWLFEKTKPIKACPERSRTGELVRAAYKAS